MILALDGCCFCCSGGRVGRADLAGSARLELVSGVVQLRPEDAMLEAMLSGWRAQQAARGLREDTVADRERLVRRFGDFTGEYPWAWSPGHMDEWSLHLTAEEHLAPSTIRAYQCTLRQFTEFLVDARYGWAAACEEAFGPGQGRSTALLTLAAEVPAAILAKTLGIHVQAAIQWQKISGGDWTAYAADISLRGQAQERASARDQHADPLPGA